MQVVLKEIFDYFWKANTLFSFCLRLTVNFWRSIFTAVLCFLNDNKLTYFCNCSLMALLLPELCFWLAHSNFFRSIRVFDLVLKFCSEKKRRELDTIPLFFIVLVNMIASLLGLSFFSRGLGFRLKFSSVAINSNVCIWVQKLIRARMARFWTFFGVRCFVSSSSYLHGL